MIISKVIKHEKYMVGKLFFRVLTVLCKYKHSLKKISEVTVNGKDSVRRKIGNWE